MVGGLIRSPNKHLTTTSPLNVVPGWVGTYVWSWVSYVDWVPLFLGLIPLFLGLVPGFGLWVPRNSTYHPTTSHPSMVSWFLGLVLGVLGLVSVS